MAKGTTSTIRRGNGVEKKPLTDKQKAALDAGRKSYKKGEKRAVKNGQKGAAVTNQILQGEALIRKLLALKPKDEDKMAEVLASFDLKAEDISEETLLHIAAINKAKGGDIAAYEKVLKAAGYLKDRVENTLKSGEENGIRIIETRISDAD